MTKPETMHSDLLISYNIHHNDYSTTFTDLVVKNLPALIRKQQICVLAGFFNIAAFGLNTPSETYFDSLVRVIGPAKKAMHQKCQNILRH